jgi:hypothetical protein
MADINVRSDSVDVEQIMRQIRGRISEKRGADYTEAELQQLASVKLERFLDPRGVRSDLVEQFRRLRVPSEPPPNFVFEDTTLYETHRGLLQTIRRLLRPVLKLFFNPDRITNALHVQSQINTEQYRRSSQDALVFEVIHNLVLDLTRLGIEVQNLKMRVESLSSRLDFDERRGRALESVVEYRRPAAAQQAPPPRPSATPTPAATEAGTVEAGATAETGTTRTEGPRAEGSGGGDRRRRRRRRRRRPGQTLAESPNTAGATVEAATGDDDRDGREDAGTEEFDDGADGPDGRDGGASDQ